MCACVKIATSHASTVSTHQKHKSAPLNQVVLPEAAWQRLVEMNCKLLVQCADAVSRADEFFICIQNSSSRSFKQWTGGCVTDTRQSLLPLLYFGLVPQLPEELQTCRGYQCIPTSLTKIYKSRLRGIHIHLAQIKLYSSVLTVDQLYFFKRL